MTKDMMKLVEEASTKSISKKHKKKSYMDDSQYQESTPKVPHLLTQPSRIVRKRKCSIVEESQQKQAADDFDTLFDRIVKKSSKKNPTKTSANPKPSEFQDKPEINKISRNIGAVKNSGVPIHLRYSKEMQERENRICSLKQTIEKEKSDRLAKDSSPSPARSTKVKVHGDLHQNTMKFLERKNNNIKRVQTDLMFQEMQQLTFKPKINDNSSKIVQKTGVGLDHTAKKRFPGTGEALQGSQSARKQAKRTEGRPVQAELPFQADHEHRRRQAQKGRLSALFEQSQREVFGPGRAAGPPNHPQRKPQNCVRAGIQGKHKLLEVRREQERARR